MMAVSFIVSVQNDRNPEDIDLPEVYRDKNVVF